MGELRHPAPTGPNLSTGNKRVIEMNTIYYSDLESKFSFVSGALSARVWILYRETGCTHGPKGPGGRRSVLSARRSQNGYQRSSQSCTRILFLFFPFIDIRLFICFRPKSFLRVPANRPKLVGHALTRPFKVSGFSVAYFPKLRSYYTTRRSVRCRTG